MKKKLVALFTATALTSLALSACGGSASNTESQDTTTTAEETADEEEVAAEVSEDDAATAGAGFEEHPIFEDAEVDFINLSAVYFQAVPMTNSDGTDYSAEDADIHIEADITAGENSLGYGVDEWIPYLTIDYSIVDQASGDEVVNGTCMPMAASDGPHYGNNIKLDPGTYDVTFTIHSPGENGYLIHSDAETGPGGLLGDVWGDGPLTYTFEGWDFAGLE